MELRWLYPLYLQSTILLSKLEQRENLQLVYYIFSFAVVLQITRFQNYSSVFTPVTLINISSKVISLLWMVNISLLLIIFIKASLVFKESKSKDSFFTSSPSLYSTSTFL